uniref:Dedicator of cytokinesis C/D N-terminal domain-containing protein n=1 Tax=Megaselia scalaris TaxID=36166 RepID=T1GW26_MEGSC
MTLNKYAIDNHWGIEFEVQYLLFAKTRVLDWQKLFMKSKPQLVEPIDFEDFLIKNKFLIQNDPQRELLMYPNDDVTEIILPRKFRTVDNNIPKFSENVNLTPNSTTNGNLKKNGEQKNGDHNGHSDLSRKKSDTGSSASSSSSSSSTLTLPRRMDVMLETTITVPDLQ